MNLLNIQDAIILRLQEIGGVSVDAFADDDLEQLIEDAVKLPAAYVLWGGCDFRGGPVTGLRVAPSKHSWKVIAIGENLRSNKMASIGLYPLIESIWDKLIQFPIGNDYLWPKSVELLYAENRRMAYGLDFSMESEFRSQ